MFEKFLIASMMSLPSVSKDSKPNILIILADDLRADCIGALGNPYIHTPNINRLVKEGTVFSNCFIMGSNSAAVSMPSRTMLLSGRNLFNLPRDINKEGSIPTVPVMPTVMHAAGYDTYYHGKIGNTYLPAIKAFDRSEEYVRPMSLKDQINADKTMVNQTIAYLNEPERSLRPFFIHLAPTLPHDPLYLEPEDLILYNGEKRPPLPPNAATSHIAFAGFRLRETNVRTYDVPGIGRLLAPLNLDQWRDIIARYYAMVTILDTYVGQILDELDRTGVAKNTIVIFASDNGHSLSDHGLIHKQSLYDHDNQVPLLIRGPGIPAGQVRDTYVYLSDIFPTLCEWAGMPIPKSVQMRSFSASITNPAKTHRSTLYAAYKNEIRSYRDDQYKLIFYNVAGTSARYTQLFNIKDDPYEIHNLVNDPAQASRLTRMISEARQAGSELGDTSILSPDKEDNSGFSSLPFWDEWDRRDVLSPTDTSK